MRARNADGRSKARRQALAGAIFGLVLTAVLAAALPAAAGHSARHATVGQDVWHKLGKVSPAQTGLQAQIRPNRFRAFTLDRASMRTRLAAAAAASTNGQLVLSLPAPNGSFQRFVLSKSDIMAPGLAAKHPEITTYYGRGLDDAAATIAADLSPIGFHASVRSPQGAWYIDPAVRNNPTRYVSYYGRDVKDGSAVPFVERDADGAELSVDHGYYHADDDVSVNGSGFAENGSVKLTISDPEEQFASRTITVNSNAQGDFHATFVADPDGNLETHIVSANDGKATTSASYQVVRSDDPTKDPPTGDVLRTYRLALITDPGYSAYLGGPANVTAGKVALINRVSQVYHDDLSITLQLIANNDLLNLNDWGAATAPNGPCGSAACFTQSQVTGCSSTTRARFVIGQIVGASGYDIGHLALGEPGGGVANLGVIGRSNKAGGCTGIPTPVGDFYAIDYVAHEMGHQFSGNHPFNGNQLNCSSGNRNAATSTEPGSGSSIMAYAGICLTDDLQPHSDPYFSQRSLQEISTYTSSTQAAINEVQTVSLRHFGGGNEVQVATFGPGYAQSATVQPLSFTLNAAPSATSRGGAEENGNTVTMATANGHTLQPGDSVTVSGVPVAGYNGTFTVTAVPSSRSFQYSNPVTGLATTGGGTVTLNAPGATESGTTVTLRTAAAHNRSVGDIVVVSGVGVAGYNGTWTVTAVPTPRSLEYTATASGLANSGGGSATYSAPFQLRFGGNDSSVIGGQSVQYSAANIQSALQALPGIGLGNATVSGAASTGFTVTFGGSLAGTDVSSLQFVNLSCGGCFGSFEETNHGGANDSFTLNYNGTVSAPIVNGTNYTAAGILAALTPIMPAGQTATVAGFAGGTFNNTGFQVTYTGTAAATNVPVLLGVQDFTAGASGFTGETDKGGAVDNKGIVTPTGDSFPAVTAAPAVTIPIRTPFALTGSATDADGDAMTYSWEQNDRGSANGTSLLNNTKADGPLFAMFPLSAPISESDTLQYNSPHENHLGSDPTRVFPDLQQILDNNTNADTGACATGPIAPPVPIPVKECFAEFLPTAAYLGTALSNNAAPPRLNMRFTARDGKGGVNSADTVVTIAAAAGPFRVTSANSAVSYPGTAAQTVTWDVANTDTALGASNVSNVKISLSTDGGHTYPTVLAASTPNDGSESVTIPNVATTHGRIKVEALGNVFFDVNNADFTIAADTTAPVSTATLSPASPNGAHGWYVSPVTVTLGATDAESGVASTQYTIDGGPTQTYTGPFTISSDGAHVVQFWSTDVAGNVESPPKSVTVKVDQTTPTTTATLTPGIHNGWYASPTLTLTGDDGTGSGIDHIDYTLDGGAAHVYSGPIGGFSTGNHFVQYHATDVAGHVEATKLIAFKVDAVKPSVTVTRPADGETFPLGKVVTAAYKCTDRESGLDTCVGTVANGANLDTSTPGDHTFTVTGTDKAGNQTVITRHYQVVYTWNGYFSPITNTGSGLNLVHAGDLVKLGFGLNGDRGLNVFAAGFPDSIAIACPGGTPHSVPAGGAGTTPGLSYGVASGHYTYGWQTQASWAGTCRRFEIKLNDGSATLHTADFMFFA
jgi:hypothetical protein